MPDVVRHCAVLGDPIAHSLSPALHRAGYQAIGLDWSYNAHRVPEGQMAGFVAGLDATWRGLSVTAPLKREALALADAVSPQARLTGAANTLLLVGVGADRRIHADNTDLPGAVAAVRERFAGEVRSATVIGAGATAASTGLALAEMGATSIRILARDAGRAATTVAAIAAHPAGPTVEVAALDSDVLGEVVVSTIPAAAQDEDLVARCAVAPVVFEVISKPMADPAGRRSERPRSGGGLRARPARPPEAALQFVAYTGHPAPLQAMRAAGEAALGDRPGEPSR